MKLVICIDAELGYSYHHRRLSRDKNIRLHLMKNIRERGGTLYMNAYTEKSFLKDEGVFLPKERTERMKCPAAPGTAFLEAARRENGWAFVENEDVTQYLPEVDEMLVYRWNRVYDADLRLPPDFAKAFTEQYTESISGSSHERVSFVRYILTEDAEGMS